MLDKLRAFATSKAGRRRGIDFRRDERGATAVEFGFVGIPFLMMCFGVITTGMHFLTAYTFENAVERAGRQIRTGELQQASRDVNFFKEQICNRVPGYMDCDTKMKVHVQSWTDFSGVQPANCLSPDGNLASGSNSGDDIADHAGGASAVVLITVCYEWELAAHLPFLRLGKMSNGSALIQAATTFRTEPYQ